VLSVVGGAETGVRTQGRAEENSRSGSDYRLIITDYLFGGEGQGSVRGSIILPRANQANFFDRLAAQQGHGLHDAESEKLEV